MQQHDSTLNFTDRLLNIAPSVRGLGVDGACVVGTRNDTGKPCRLVCRDHWDAKHQLTRILTIMSERGLCALFGRWVLAYDADTKTPVVVTTAERERIEKAETHGDQEEADTLRRILAVKLREAHAAGRPVYYEATAQEQPEPVTQAAE